MTVLCLICTKLWQCLAWQMILLLKTVRLRVSRCHCGHVVCPCCRPRGDKLKEVKLIGETPSAAGRAQGYPMYPCFQQALQEAISMMKVSVWSAWTVASLHNDASTLLFRTLQRA